LGKIIRLDAHVADLIAAGEVVERPASVVKELMENAIDAGAGKITVEIKGGGMTYIRVTDNGSGIPDEDTETAFLRHATSKLRDEKGLEAIRTLGFRGEALAAIAAVSRIELLTRETGAGEGTSLSLEGGVVTAHTAAGCPEGTTIIVRDLFYNTPARLKFMKTDRAEGAAVSAVVWSCALSHPEVSVRYIKDGKEECHTPGDGRMDSCIYSLFGRDFMNGLLPADTSDGDVTVTGYVSTPDAARGNRTGQYFFVNGRPVRSKTLQAALEQAYKNRLFTGRFPACVLYITLRPGDVDVNVHPTKTEVKFVREHQVFDGVYYAALSALEGYAANRAAPREETAPPIAERKPNETIIDRPARDVTIKPAGGGTAPARSRYDGAVIKAFGNRIPAAAETGLYAPVRDNARQAYKTSAPARPAQEPPDIPRQLALEEEPAAETPPYRLIGETLGTYILVERGQSLWLIDKHAAHERIHFDRLRRERQEAMSQTAASQTLLEPLICTLGSEDTALLLEHAGDFERLGFSLEPFGETALAVRQIPADMDKQDIEALLGEAGQLLRRGGRPDGGLFYDELLHMVACKAAIKAGKSSQPAEMHALIARVFSGEITHCPHGRPVAVELTKASLDKSFKRG
jgi:DNA mismatch repair protein MutL